MEIIHTTLKEVSSLLQKLIMVVYSCHCLNIQLYAEPPSHRLDPENLASCPLGSDIELVELIDQGLQCSQKCLVHRSKVGPWMVYVCVLCKTPTHAVDQDANLVAVSTSMKKGKTVIENMRQRKDFSDVFGLLLDPNEERGNGEIQNQTFDTMQKQLVELQGVLSGFLRQEEDAMEKRIRKYEEEQRAKFETLRENCQKEKTKLISLLFNSSEGHVSHFTIGGEQNVTEAPKTIIRPHVPLSQTKSAGVVDSVPEKRLSRPLSSSSSRRSRDSRDLSPDDMFAMDEFEAILDSENDNSPRQSNSPRQGRAAGQPSVSSLESRLRQEDRNNSNYPTGSSSRSRSRGKDTTPPLMDGNASHQNAAAQRVLLSSSVPISMPINARNLHNNSNHDEDIDEESTDFDDIPRHMQALSESIQERDRYIFGDRPRQRVNTGDFTRVNWR